jgi:hypothetical protein
MLIDNSGSRRLLTQEVVSLSIPGSASSSSIADLLIMRPIVDGFNNDTPCKCFGEHDKK